MEDILPKTADEAADYYIPRFEGMDKYFQEMDEDTFAVFCHSMLSGGIGMIIRNEMGFWSQDTELYHHMVNVQKINHPDDMSDHIIRLIYRKKHTT